jgi:apolipoprotein N-acyltransferase
MKSTVLVWILNLLILPLLSGVCMVFAWPNNGFFPLLFVGLVPWFFSLDFLGKSSSKWSFLGVLFVSFLAHYSWISVSLHWLEATSPKTYQIAVVLESFTLALAMLFVPLKSKRTWLKWGGLICAWLFIEYFNQNWMIGTPYFILGQGFGMHPDLIQFYEFIGVEGGTVILLLINVFAFFVFKSFLSKSLPKKELVVLGFLLLPFFISFSTFSPQEDTDFEESENVVAMHTLVEPSSKIFVENPKIVIDSLWNQSEKYLDANTTLLVWPETVVAKLGWLNGLPAEAAYQTLNEKLKKYPNLSICTGGYGYSVCKVGKEDPYARFLEMANLYYLTHNVAVTINNSGRWPVRSKKKFIPFQERIPFLKQVPSLANFADFVGANTMVSYYEYGEDYHKTKNGNFYAPMLCFESIYPLDMSEKASESQFVVILANENWNKDLTGSTQYLYTNVGMAIQSRIPIVRSSNSGTSAFLNSKGTIQKTRFSDDIGGIKMKILFDDVNQTMYDSIRGIFYMLGTLLYVTMFVILLAQKFFFKKA